MLSPHLHISIKHNNDFVDVELPSTAKSEQILICEPRIQPPMLLLKPLLQLLKDLFLMLCDISKMPDEKVIVKNSGSFSLNQMKTYPLGFAPLRYVVLLLNMFVTNNIIKVCLIFNHKFLILN
jgi:hypothetical protein